MVQRIKGYAQTAYSYVNTLLQIIGWGGLALALTVGIGVGFMLGAAMFWD